MTTNVVNMVLDRETKGALVYKEVDAKGDFIENAGVYSIGTLYLRKHAFPDKPQAIRVEVSTLE